MMNDTLKVTVIGDGGWGTALATVLDENGHDVTVWGPFEDAISAVRDHGENTSFLPGVALPQSISWTADIDEASSDADMVLFVVPTKYFRHVAESFQGRIPASCRIVTASKGFDRESHYRMSELLSELFSDHSISALSGPSHAEEVARRIPTAVTLASADVEIARQLQEIFATRRFRVYTSPDIAGVEFGGGFKNVIAIAVGISDGMGFGDNTRAALITRGLHEMTRLGVALGADPVTFYGLSGMGDLIVTCTSELSRNRSVGEQLGRGKKLAAILSGTNQAIEGVWNCASVVELANKLSVDVPISEQVYAIVHKDLDPSKAVERLLSRDLVAETREP